VAAENEVLEPESVDTYMWVGSGIGKTKVPLIKSVIALPIYF